MHLYKYWNQVFCRNFYSSYNYPLNVSKCIAFTQYLSSFFLRSRKLLRVEKNDLSKVFNFWSMKFMDVIFIIHNLKLYLLGSKKTTMYIRHIDTPDFIFLFSISSKDFGKIIIFNWSLLFESSIYSRFIMLRLCPYSDYYTTVFLLYPRNRNIVWITHGNRTLTIAFTLFDNWRWSVVINGKSLIFFYLEKH